MTLGLVLVNGRIWTGRRQVEALAVQGGRVVAAGDADDALTEGGKGAIVVDLEQRRAIPGLIDSHIHLVRAGLSWNDIVRWDDVGDLKSGLERIRATTAERPGNEWIRVLGGWHPAEFPEGRGPTRTELDDAGGEHPVYVQLLYEEGTLNSRGLELLLSESDVPGVERDEAGNPTGRVTGPATFARILSLFGRPTEEESIASTTALMEDLASRGVTGVIDPGGFGITPHTYDPLFRIWREDSLPLRVRLYLVPATRGDELDEIRRWVEYIHPGFGDDMLRYVGMGEIVHFGCHDMEGVTPYEMSDDARRGLAEISGLLASHDWPIHLHAILDSTISDVLDVWEEVDRKYGLQGRRFSLAHAEPIGRHNLERVRDLGVGLAVQNRLMFRNADSAAVWGEEVAHNSPPLGDIIELGIPVGGGTDATVVTPHDPWRSLQWLVTGESVDGAPPRNERHRLTVEQALSVFTTGSSWFSFDEHERGYLEPGALADVAVLDRDPFTTDPAALFPTRSELTLVGGRPVHVGEPFRGLETDRPPSFRP